MKNRKTPRLRERGPIRPAGSKLARLATEKRAIGGNRK